MIQISSNYNNIYIHSNNTHSQDTNSNRPKKQHPKQRKHSLKLTIQDNLIHNIALTAQVYDSSSSTHSNNIIHTNINKSIIMHRHTIQSNVTVTHD